MSGNGTEDRTAPRKKDPLLRFLAGCAVAALVLAAIVVCGAVLIGWRLGRDEAPGRPPESFLVGDETRYWSLNLKPDDAGLKALFARIDAINDAARRDVLRGTFLEGIPLPHRRARLDELAPFSVELGLTTNGPGSGLAVPTGWEARGTFSHGVFRMRAAMKLIRFLASRDAAKAKTTDVDGVVVTEVHDENTSFAVATVGNRVLVTNDASRMRAVLRSGTGSFGRGRTELLALHDRIALPGEDAWAFTAATRLGDLSRGFAIDGAAASFDVNERDELAFRVLVVAGSRSDEGNAFRGSRDDCSVLVSTFLPGVAQDAIAIDGEGASPGDRGGQVCSGRISGLSTQLARLVGRARELRLRGRPFAIPIPPPPGETDDPRSGIPAAPTRAENPKPPR